MWWRKKSAADRQAPAGRGGDQSPAERSDSVLFQSLIGQDGPGVDLIVPWSSRAQSLDAKPMRRDKGLELLLSAWSHQGPSQPFGRDDVTAIAQFFSFVAMPAEREVIQQDEYGDFMLVQLSGVIGVERMGPDGVPVRMAETDVGDLIGEMSLLDHGLRFSSCVTLTPCVLAVLTREALEEMVHNQPQLAARLALLLARKLSVRLRAVSAKLRR